MVNDSLNQTLSRTVLTGGTAIFASFALYFWGGPVIATFGLAMGLGIIVGTYSSLYVATPILLALQKRYGKQMAGSAARRRDPGGKRRGERPARPELCGVAARRQRSAREASRARRAALPAPYRSSAACLSRPCAPRRRRRAGAAPAAPACLVIWIEPFTTAPSATTRRGAATSPSTIPVAWISIRSLPLHVAGHAPDHHHGLRAHLGLDDAVGAHRELVVGKLDLALDLALDHEVLVAGQVALDRDRLSDVRHAVPFADRCGLSALAAPVGAGRGRERGESPAAWMPRARLPCPCRRTSSSPPSPKLGRRSLTQAPHRIDGDVAGLQDRALEAVQVGDRGPVDAEGEDLLASRRPPGRARAAARRRASTRRTRAGSARRAAAPRRRARGAGRPRSPPGRSSGCAPPRAPRARSAARRAASRPARGAARAPAARRRVARRCWESGSRRRRRRTIRSAASLVKKSL